ALPGGGKMLAVPATESPTRDVTNLARHARRLRKSPPTPRLPPARPPPAARTLQRKGFVEPRAPGAGRFVVGRNRRTPTLGDRRRAGDLARAARYPFHRGCRRSHSRAHSRARRTLSRRGHAGPPRRRCARGAVGASATRRTPLEIARQHTRWRLIRP